MTLPVCPAQNVFNPCLSVSLLTISLHLLAGHGRHTPLSVLVHSIFTNPPLGVPTRFQYVLAIPYTDTLN